jgi:hypothetical protein
MEREKVMPKKTRSYMVRRGHRYLIERTSDGTFARCIPLGSVKKKAKKSSAKAAGKKALGLKTTKKNAGRGKSASSRSRA